LLVLLLSAADEAHRSHPVTIVVKRGFGGRPQLLAVGKTEIVVGAEIQHLPAARHFNLGRLHGSNHTLRLVEAGLPKLLQLALDVGKKWMCHGVAAGCEKMRACLSTNGAGAPAILPSGPATCVDLSLNFDSPRQVKSPRNYSRPSPAMHRSSLSVQPWVLEAMSATFHSPPTSFRDHSISRCPSSPPSGKRSNVAMTVTSSPLWVSVSLSVLETVFWSKSWASSAGAKSMQASWSGFFLCASSFNANSFVTGSVKRLRYCGSDSTLTSGR